MNDRPRIAIRLPGCWWLALLVIMVWWGWGVMERLDSIRVDVRALRRDVRLLSTLKPPPAPPALKLGQLPSLVDWPETRKPIPEKWRPK